MIDSVTMFYLGLDRNTINYTLLVVLCSMIKNHNCGILNFYSFETNINDFMGSSVSSINFELELIFGLKAVM